MTKLSWTSIIGGFFAIIAVFLLHHTFDEIYSTSLVTAGRGPVFFPRILLGVMLVLAVAIIWEGWREGRQSVSIPQIVPLLGTIVFTGVYIYAITAIGFLINNHFREYSATDAGISGP